MANPMDSYGNIQELLDLGATVKAISKMTGVPLDKVKIIVNTIQENKAQQRELNSKYDRKAMFYVYGKNIEDKEDE